MTWRDVLKTISSMQGDDLDKEIVMVAESNGKICDVEIVAIDQGDCPFFVGNVFDSIP